MKNPNETLIMIWLGLLIAPPILFGLWMRYKLYQTEHGGEFLYDREVAKSKGRRDVYGCGDETRDTAGKLARGAADANALRGSHGSEVSEILRKSIPFMIGYVVYAVIGVAVGVFLVV